MMRMRFLPVILALLTALPAAAQQAGEAGGTPPPAESGGLYFSPDNATMTPLDMAREAEEVHNLCESHSYQRIYFDCACIAGAFLRERERVGPLVAQSSIITELFRTGGTLAKCGNGPAIAGEMYGFCQSHVAVFRPYETTNEDYCQCAANRMARDFMDYPYLRTAYINRLRVNAMLACEERYPAIHSIF